MCGIFGIVAPSDTQLSRQDIEKLLRQLYIFSESRGKESAGIHVHLVSAKQSWTLKSAQPASDFIESDAYKNIINEIFFAAEKNIGPFVAIAHSRLVTNGKSDDAKNNQPVHYDGVSVVHNGIIVNAEELWLKNAGMPRYAEVDTEIISALLSRACLAQQDPISSTAKLFAEISGTASIAWLSNRAEHLILASNTGDLFYCQNTSLKYFCFASERHIINKALAASFPSNQNTITWLQPKTGLYVDSRAFSTKIFSLSAVINTTKVTPELYTSTHHDRTLVEGAQTHSPYIINKNVDENLLRYSEANLAVLRRCRHCILPETFPFIRFDEQGVCNYCRGYKPKYKNVDMEQEKRDFIALMEKYRLTGEKPDVILPFSGGRDSCYGLHLIKKEFGLNPISFTYDWGMVTDLARRNIARVCGELGVQNILVSADIKTKRDNIRKNISAWLKKPDLGMVPLFMAGDKHFFTIVNQLKKQTGIELNLWCANPLENTDFKSGFCGIRPSFDKSRVDYLSLTNKIKLATYSAKQFATNPSYFNSSMTDSISSFLAYYFTKRSGFYSVFHHMVWDEDAVNKTIIDKYDFELSPDSPSTWRIGDGTAPFYNYIYLTACGFSEFDTFRSNQIREGMITREYGLQQVLRENRPRVQSLRWYLDIVGLDFNSTIKRINQMDTAGIHS